MKGFQKFGKGAGKANHSFPESSGFTGSTGKVQSVSGYTRRTPAKKCDGGAMAYQDGGAVVKRDEPTTEADAKDGGKGPLLPGFKAGGRAPKKAVKGSRPAFMKSPLVGGDDC